MPPAPPPAPPAARRDPSGILRGIGALVVILIAGRALWVDPWMALAALGAASLGHGRRSPPPRLAPEPAPPAPPLRALLACMGEAAALIDVDGRFLGPCSPAMAALLPALRPGQSFLAALGALDAEAGCAAELGWELLRAQGLAPATELGLLPTTLDQGGQRRALRFAPVDEDDAAQGIWAIIGPPEGAAEASAEQQRSAAELLALCGALVEDPDGLLDFVDGAREAVLRVVGEAARPGPRLRRELRSLRAAAAYHRLGGLDSAAAAVEDALQRADPEAMDAAVAGLCGALGAVEARLAQLPARRREHIELSQAEWIDVQQQIRDGVSADALLDTLYFWGDERAAVRIERLVRQAQDRAARLGVEAEISGGAGDLRMAAGRFARLWGVLPHLLENALQHGIEGRSTRLVLGKPPRGLVALRARPCRRPQAPALGALRLGAPAPAGASWLRIDVNDDGRGLDWAEVAAVAAAAPVELPPLGAAELGVRALFSAAFATRAGEQDPPQGIAAVLAEVRRLGGCLELQSRPGFGCAVTLFLPLTDVDQRAEAPA